MNPQIFTLANGLRCVYLQRPGNVMHCGIVVGCGSRDEAPSEQGTAHLIEHMLFKGTKKRNMFNILNSLDRLGGELNAFTSKEETWIHASVESGHWKNAIEVISDIVQNSTFPAAEIIREKEVVIDEMNAYKDQPGEMIFEEFDKVLFGSHGLGRSILGTESSIKELNRKNVYGFFQRHYKPDYSVFSLVGQENPKDVEKWIDRCFGSWKKSTIENSPRIKPASQRIRTLRHETDNHQAHFVTGCKTVDLHHPDRRIVAIITNYLGGPALNSKLSYELREKNGIAYHIEANYTPFHDSGVFSIYAGTSDESLAKMEKLIWKELEKVASGNISSRQMESMKTQISGQLTLAQESPASEMFHLGRSILIYDMIESHEEILQSVKDVKLEDFHRVSHKLLQGGKFSTLIYA
ncbi:MAG: pitrilysin family protein [Flavobacteriales bacterium]|nr:pitrilysin family protein [Flavobacteriales bacterium]